MILPPRRAGQNFAKADDLLHQRDRHVQTIRDKGRMAWQKASAYDRRALVEATTSRSKRFIGTALKSRRPDAQHTEAMFGGDILDQMVDLGRPVTVQIGWQSREWKRTKPSLLMQQSVNVENTR